MCGAGRAGSAGAVACVAAWRCGVLVGRRESLPGAVGVAGLDVGDGPGCRAGVNQALAARQPRGPAAGARGGGDIPRAPAQLAVATTAARQPIAAVVARRPGGLGRARRPLVPVTAAQGVPGPPAASDRPQAGRRRGAAASCASTRGAQGGLRRCSREAGTYRGARERELQSNRAVDVAHGQALAGVDERELGPSRSGDIPRARRARARRPPISPTGISAAIRSQAMTTPRRSRPTRSGSGQPRRPPPAPGSGSGGTYRGRVELELRRPPRPPRAVAV